MANILTIVFALALVVTPFLAGAQFNLPDPGGTGLTGGITNESTLTGFILRVINIALALAGLIAVLFLIIGGFRYITAGGNDEAAGSAKKIILNAVIGIIVVILSFVVVRVVGNTLTTTNL
ncbi:MAG TPA: hypothetical protein VEC17_02820 [Candidatus Binatia bacterium]|nr:hypothetical protein [Candidatus Binatia bacterium]